jgi:hypothetical protein
MSVQFEDYSAKVMEALDDAALKFLYEAAGEIEAQTKQNTRVDTGQTKNAWAHVVDEGKKEATVGNPLENSIWEEFGTGEFALEGNGRKGGWVYVDDEGKGHFTYGKKPNRAFQTAYNVLKNPLIQRAQEIFKERLDK